MYQQKRETEIMKDISLPFNLKTHPFRMVFYAIFFSIMLFLVLPLSQLYHVMIEKKEIVRPIDIIARPPEEPERTEQEKEITLQEVISIQSVASDIELEPLDVTLDASLEGDLEIKIDTGIFKVKGSYGKEDLLADIKMFSLAELDTTPMSLNDPLLRSPKELIEQGVEEINAEALVILTEKGEVEFVRFISLSHQGANAAVREYIQKLRYTPPKKDGEVGRVRFRLPIRSKVDGSVQ
tara:strand:+ start:88005 stop:88718 length:714 start_codon:yes stop_codon:yes gene_type:complete